MNVETSLMTLKLKEQIIKNLEDRCRKTGINDAVSWRGIWIELGAAEEDFCKALKSAAGAHGHAEIVFTDPDHIKLASKAGFKTQITHANGASLKAGASNRVYGLALRFSRLFLHFVKEKTQQQSVKFET